MILINRDAKAIYSCEAEHSNELSFPQGAHFSNGESVCPSTYHSVILSIVLPFHSIHLYLSFRGLTVHKNYFFTDLQSLEAKYENALPPLLDLDILVRLVKYIGAELFVSEVEEGCLCNI